MDAAARADAAAEAAVADVEDYLASAARDGDVDASVAQLAALAPQRGLARDTLERVVAAATHERCPKGAANALLKCLFPREAVGRRAIELLLGGFARLSLRAKGSALKWLILVNRKLSEEATATLHAAYAALFHFVDLESTRPLLCRLLYMLTRRRDVTRFRVSRLTALVRNLIEAGQDAGALLLLYDLFAQYAPETVAVIPKRFGRAKAAFFRPPDERWRQDLERMERLLRHEREAAPPPRGGLRASPDLQEALLEGETAAMRHDDEVQRLGGLRTAVPARRHKRQRPPDLTGTGGPKRSRSDVDHVSSAAQLAKALRAGDASFPERCAAILSDSVFQSLLCVCPREEQVLRLRHMLPFLVEEEFFSVRDAALADSRGPDDPALPKPMANRVDQLASQAQLLATMADFCDFMQQTLPELERFVVRFLETWNGVHHVGPVLRLVARLQPRSYADLHREVLKPLYRLYMTCSAALKAHILEALTALLRNWAEIDWESHLAATRLEPADDSAKLEPAASSSSGTKPQAHRFTPIPGGVDYYKVIFEFVTYVDQIILAGLIDEEDHELLQVQAGAFFRTAADLHTAHHLPFVVPPSPGIVYRLLLSPTLLGQEVLCGILVRMRASFTALRSHVANKMELSGGATDLPTESGLEKMALFNSYVWDACNTLWLDKPLPKPPGERRKGETTSVLFELADETGLTEAMRKLPPQQVAGAFNLVQSLPFHGIAARFARERGVAIDTLLGSAALKSDLLDYLQDEVGCVAVVDFLCSFISSLVKRRREQAPESPPAQATDAATLSP